MLAKTLALGLFLLTSWNSFASFCDDGRADAFRASITGASHTQILLETRIRDLIGRRFLRFDRSGKKVSPIYSGNRETGIESMVIPPFSENNFGIRITVSEKANEVSIVYHDTETE